jgi:beta-lactamase superfamily II metal-dependent hydrolase
LGQNITASVLFIPDPGNPVLTGPKLLSAVGPRVIITGAAANPAPDVFTGLMASGAELYRLDQTAAIELSTDGRQVSVTTVK